MSRRQSLSYGNGTTTSYRDEVDDDLKTLKHIFRGGGAVTFNDGYDMIGNRLKSQVSDDRFQYLPQAATATTTYTPNRLNQYSTVNSVSFNYDNNGNLSADGVNNYAYDSGDHPDGHIPIYTKCHDRRIAREKKRRGFITPGVYLQGDLHPE